MYDYGPNIIKAKEMIDKYGSPLTWTQKVVKQPDDPDKPWKTTGTDDNTHIVSGIVFPPAGGTGLYDADFEDGTTSVDSYRYVIVAGEGRSIKPISGDTIGVIDGKRAVVLGCKALDPANQGSYILYELGVKL